MNPFIRALVRNVLACTLLWLALFFPVPALAASCIWVATNDTLRQINTETNQVTQTVALKEARALAMNATDCSVWALAGHDLYQFDGNAVNSD